MVEGVFFLDFEFFDEDWEEGELLEFMVEVEEMFFVIGLIE